MATELFALLGCLTVLAVAQSQPTNGRRPTPPPTSVQPASACNHGRGCEQGWNCVNVTVTCFTTPCPPIPTCQQDCSTIDCAMLRECEGGGRPVIPENECCAQCPCRLSCRYGFAANAAGDEICECAAAPFAEPTVAPTQCWRTESQAPCRNFCRYGRVRDENGCYGCTCNQSPPRCNITGQTWNDCGSHCAPACVDGAVERGGMCLGMCVPQCQCPRDKVLDEAAGACIDEEDCRPSTEAPTEGCQEVLCDMFCEQGWQIDEETGCETCQCATGNRCRHGGAEHNHGSTWVDASNPCMRHECVNGEVMSMAMSCMPDEMLQHDQCGGGPIARADDVCCAFCADGPSEAPGTCSVTNSHTGPDAVVYNDGDAWEYPDDFCTTYVCHAGEVIDQMIMCDEPRCGDDSNGHPIRPVNIEGECCASCPDPEINRNCTDPSTGVVHAHNEHWSNQGRPCTTHHCENGRIMTMSMSCLPPEALSCPRGEEARSLPEVCCPQCVPITASPVPAPPTCGPVCAVYCEYGNVEDDFGCPTCECATPPPTTPRGPVCNPPCSGDLSVCNLVTPPGTRPVGTPTCQQDCTLVRCAHNIVCWDGSNGTVPENMCCPVCPTNPGTFEPSPAPTSLQSTSAEPSPAPSPAPTTDPCDGVTCRPASLCAGTYAVATPGQCCGTCITAPPVPGPPTCGPVCAVHCLHGNVIDAFGCPTCECASPPSTSQPTPAPTADSDPSGSTGQKEGNSETSEIAIIVAVAALLICMIITGFVLLAKSKRGDSGRQNYDNPMYADVVVNNTGRGIKPQRYSIKSKPAPAQEPQYESSAPALDDEMDC